MLAKWALIGSVALIVTTNSGFPIISSASASKQFAGLEGGSSPSRTFEQVWAAPENSIAETAINDNPALILAQGIGRTGDDNGGGGVFGKGDPGSGAGRGLESANNGVGPNGGAAGGNMGGNMGNEGGNTGNQGGEQGGDQGGDQGGQQGGGPTQGGGPPQGGGIE